MVIAPPIQLTAPPEPSEEECDRVLGAYLRAWNQIEHALEALISKLIESNPTTGHIISASISDWRTRRELIEALAAGRLRKSDKLTVSGILDKVSRANTKRNRLVHGKWTLLINVHRDKDGAKRAVVGKWVRADWSGDFDKMREIRSNPKVRKQHEYGVQQIANLTNSTRTLARLIASFSEALTLLPYVPPTPLDIT
jgi:hypothetical protein